SSPARAIALPDRSSAAELIYRLEEEERGSIALNRTGSPFRLKTPRVVSFPAVASAPPPSPPANFTAGRGRVSAPLNLDFPSRRLPLLYKAGAKAAPSPIWVLGVGC